MRNLVYMIFLIPVALWALSGGIHWGSSLILTLLSIVMFFGVVWCDLRRRRMPLGRDMSWLAPYRGIGLVGIGLVASICRLLCAAARADECIDASLAWGFVWFVGRNRRSAVELCESVFDRWKSVV